MHKPHAYPEPEATFFFSLLCLCGLTCLLQPHTGVALEGMSLGIRHSPLPILELSHVCLELGGTRFKQCTENQYTIREYVWRTLSFTGTVIYSVFAQTLKTAKRNISRWASWKTSRYMCSLLHCGLQILSTHRFPHWNWILCCNNGIL